MTTQKENKSMKNALIQALNALLADYQIYYQNLRGLHWNIQGKMFFSLHEKFENYYNEAAEEIDEIAERVLMLNGNVVHRYTDYLDLATIKELETTSKAVDAVKAVADNSSQLLSKLKELVKNASEAEDDGTVDLLTGLITSTEKRIWMLSAFMKGVE
jgi:starvation-inducible DNA-binding protein